MKRIDSFRNTVLSQTDSLNHSVLKKSNKSSANLFKTTRIHSESKQLAPVSKQNNSSQNKQLSNAAKIQTKVIGYASNQSGLRTHEVEKSNLIKSRQSYGLISQNNTLALPSSRSASNSKGSDVCSKKSRATASKPGSFILGNGQNYTQKFKKYRPCLAPQSKTKHKSKDGESKENEYTGGICPYPEHSKSQEKKQNAGNSMLLAFKRKNMPQTQQPSVNASHSSSHNLLPGIGIYHRYHTSSQSSTIKNFKSIDNTESLEKDNKLSRQKSKTRRVKNATNDNVSSSQQRMSNEEMPNRPKTSINAGVGKAANKLAYGTAEIRPKGSNQGWNTERQMIVPNSTTNRSKKKINIETNGFEIPNLNSESNSFSSRRIEQSFRATGSKKKSKKTASRRTINSNDYPNESDKQTFSRINQVMYDTIPQNPKRMKNDCNRSSKGFINSNKKCSSSQRSRKIKNRVQNSLREIDKEGTVSSESRGESFNRPNINARFQRTSNLIHQNDQIYQYNNRQQQSYELYLKQKEEVIVSNSRQQPMTTLRSGQSYDPSGQAENSEVTTKVLGVGGVQQMVRVGEIPKFERSPEEKNAIQAYELPRSIVCFQGMPKGRNTGQIDQIQGYHQMTRHQFNSNDDFFTPRSRMDIIAGRNQMTTQRQGSQQPPNSMLEMIRDGHRSIISSLFGEKISNKGAKSSSCRSKDRIELAIAPNGGAGSLSNKRKSHPFLVQSKSWKNNRTRTQSSNESHVSRHSSQISNLSLHSQRRRKAQIAWNKGLQSRVSSIQQRVPQNTVTSATKRNVNGNFVEEVNMKVIHANTLNDGGKSAYNHMHKIRTSKIQGILKKFGVHSNSSNTGQYTQKQSDNSEMQDSQFVDNLACFGKEYASQNSVAEVKKETSGRPSANMQQILPQDVTFFFNGQNQAVQKPELITFQKLDQKHTTDSVISSIISPHYSSLRSPRKSNLPSPRPLQTNNPIATQDSPLNCPALLNSSIRSPEISMANPNKSNGNIYLALYDRHLSSSLYTTTFTDIVSSQDDYKMSQLVSIPGMRLCFDTALSDCPYVQEITDDSNENEHMLQVRMQKLNYNQLIKILKKKATEGESGPMIRGRVVETIDHQNYDIYVQWEIDEEGKDEIKRYVKQKDSEKMVDDDESSRLDQIICNHIRYLHYNCAKQLPFSYDGSPVYIITNDQSKLPLTFKKRQIDIESDCGVLQSSTCQTTDELTQTLDLINRYHLFSRIKDRAGAPTRQKLAEVKNNHQNVLQLIIEGLLECSETSEINRMTWHEAYDYIQSCKGSQINFDQWKTKHKNAKLCKGLYYQTNATNNSNKSNFSNMDQRMMHVKATLQEPMAQKKATSEKKNSMSSASPPIQVLAQTSHHHNHLQTEQDKYKYPRYSSQFNPHGTQPNQESANSRIDFTLTSNTNGTYTNNQVKEEVVNEDAYMPQTILDQSRHQSESCKFTSRNEVVQKYVSFNTKRQSSTLNDKAHASETTSRNANGDQEGQDEIVTLRGVNFAVKQQEGQVQNTNGTESGSSVRGQEQRHLNINNHLLATTSQSNCSFEEKNFQNQQSTSDQDVGIEINDQREQNMADATEDDDQIVESKYLQAQVDNEQTSGHPMVLNTDGQEIQDLNDLSKSLVKSIIFNDKNLRTILQERIRSFNQRNQSGTEDKKKNRIDSDMGKQLITNRRKNKNSNSYVDSQTVSSSEKIFVLNRFNDLQFQKQSSGSFGDDADYLKADVSPIIKTTGGNSSCDGKLNNNEDGALLADLFLDQLIQMTQDNMKNQDTHAKSGNSDLLFQQLGSMIELNKSLSKNDQHRNTQVTTQNQVQKHQFASIINPRMDNPHGPGTNSLSKLPSHDKHDLRKLKQSSSCSKQQIAPINNAPLPFPTESINSSLSLRRESVPIAPSNFPNQSQSHLANKNQPAPILIKDLSEIQPCSDGKRRLSNDLMAVLESVLKRSKVGGPPPALESINVASINDNATDVKKKYEMVFSGLEELLASLKREYQLKFQERQNSIDAVNQKQEWTNESSNSDIDQLDFDEHVKIRDGKCKRTASKSPQRTKKIREQLAEYGSVKSVKVVDVSASDINEQFLSNIALLRRISTINKSQNIQKSPSGLPEIQICSDLDAKQQLLDDSIEKINQKEDSISVRRDDTQASASVLLGSKQSETQALLNADKFTMKDQSLINKMKTASSYRYSNHYEVKQISEIGSVPLAKIDLTLNNLETVKGSFAQQHVRQSNALAQQKLKNLRGLGTMTPTDKENQL